MRYCPDLPECNGHIAKYDNCLAEALHECASGTHGWADEETGSCDWIGYMWLILCHDSIIVEADEWSGRFNLTIAPGTYVTLFVNDQGGVSMTPFDTAEEAKAAFDAFEREYSIWEEASYV